VAEKLTKDELRAQRRAEWEKKASKESRDAKFKKYGIWSIVAVVVIGVLFVFYKAAVSNPSSSLPQTVNIPPVTASDVQTGPKNAKVTLVEYSDFQCPTCGLYYPIVKQLESDFKDSVNFVYRFFPLVGVHQNAKISAQAAYAANLQGKFSEMEDKLFTNQKDWAESSDPMPIFEGYAKEIGLDLEKYNADLQADSTAKVMDDAYQNAVSSGIQGTPTFFLNGQPIQNPNGYDDFKNLLNSALSSK